MKNIEKEMTKFKEVTLPPRYKPFISLLSPTLSDNAHEQTNQVIQSSIISKDDITNKFTVHFTEKKKDHNAESNRIKISENDLKRKDLNDVIENKFNPTKQNSGVYREANTGNSIHSLTDNKENRESIDREGNNRECISQSTDDQSCTS